MERTGPHQGTPRDPEPRGPLSRSDPPPDVGNSNRTPVLLIAIVVLVVTAMVVLHLTGAVGPGTH